MSIPPRTVRVKDDLWQAATAAATRDGTSVSEVVRAALSAYVSDSEQVHVARYEPDGTGALTLVERREVRRRAGAIDPPLHLRAGDILVVAIPGDTTARLLPVAAPITITRGATFSTPPSGLGAVLAT